MAMARAEQGGGFLKLRTVDFPSAEGLLLIQGVCGGAAAARRRSGLLFVFFIGVQLDLFVIFLSFWTFL
jgi:hypothetical protein